MPDRPRRICELTHQQAIRRCQDIYAEILRFSELDDWTPEQELLVAEFGETDTRRVWLELVDRL